MILSVARVSVCPALNPPGQHRVALLAAQDRNVQQSIPARPWPFPVRSAEEFQRLCGSVEQAGTHGGVRVLAAAVSEAHTAAGLHRDILSRMHRRPFLALAFRRAKALT